MALIVDAGPLYACIDRDDRHHADCVELLATHPGPLIVPGLVITEVVQLVEHRLGNEVASALVGDLANGNLIAERVTPADWLRIGELVERYRDLPLGVVDASVIAAAERLSVEEIATLDRSRFEAVRSQLGSLTLLP